MVNCLCKITTALCLLCPAYHCCQAVLPTPWFNLFLSLNAGSQHSPLDLGQKADSEYGFRGEFQKCAIGTTSIYTAILAKLPPCSPLYRLWCWHDGDVGDDADGGDTGDSGDGDAGGDADRCDAGGSVYPDAAPLPPWVSVRLGVPRSQQQKSRGIILLTRNRVKLAPLVKPSSLTVP